MPSERQFHYKWINDWGFIEEHIEALEEYLYDVQYEIVKRGPRCPCGHSATLVCFHYVV